MEDQGGALKTHLHERLEVLRCHARSGGLLLQRLREVCGEELQEERENLGALGRRLHKASKRAGPRRRREVVRVLLLVFGEPVERLEAVERADGRQHGGDVELIFRRWHGREGYLVNVL